MVDLLAGQVTQRVTASDRLITHVTDYMVAAATLSGKTKPLFSVDGGTAGPYTRNADIWLPGLDWSCVPVRVDYGSGNVSTQYRGCLVTAQHMVAVNHAGFTAGHTVYFLGSDDQMYSRTISSVDTSLSALDLRVAKLSSALPSAVSPAKMLPASVGDWVTANDYTTGLPIAVLDQELKVVSHRWTGHITDNFASMPTETVSPMSTYAEAFIAGDSASPCFIVINDEPILLALAASSAQSGPSMHLNRAGLDASVTSLGGGQTITSCDLTMFTQGENE
jgi:hypothetical protein